MGFQLLVGIYGGYFGAGIGILMLSSLAFLGIPNIHEMNAVKNILAATMNGISAVIFALAAWWCGSTPPSWPWPPSWVATRGRASRGA